MREGGSSRVGADRRIDMFKVVVNCSAGAAATGSQEGEKDGRKRVSDDSRWFVRLIVAGGLTADEPTSIVVHNDPNCGCCTGGVRHLRDAGLAVRVEENSDITT